MTILLQGWDSMLHALINQWTQTTDGRDLSKSLNLRLWSFVIGDVKILWLRLMIFQSYIISLQSWLIRARDKEVD